MFPKIVNKTKNDSRRICLLPSRTGLSELQLEDNDMANTVSWLMA